MVKKLKKLMNLSSEKKFVSLVNRDEMKYDG